MNFFEEEVEECVKRGLKVIHASAPRRTAVTLAADVFYPRW